MLRNLTDLQLLFHGEQLDQPQAQQSIDPAQTFNDFTGRPRSILDDCRPVEALM